MLRRVLVGAARAACPLLASTAAAPVPARLRLARAMSAGQSTGDRVALAAARAPLRQGEVAPEGREAEVIFGLRGIADEMPTELRQAFSRDNMCRPAASASRVVPVLALAAPPRPAPQRRLPAARPLGTRARLAGPLAWLVVRSARVARCRAGACHHPGPPRRLGWRRRENIQAQQHRSSIESGDTARTPVSVTSTPRARWGPPSHPSPGSRAAGASQS